MALLHWNAIYRSAGIKPDLTPADPDGHQRMISAGNGRMEIHMIGQMKMPGDFPYRDVYRKGKPQHSKTDPFRLRHPAMDPGRRAKIFNPFDALRGFRESIWETEQRQDISDLSDAAEGEPDPM